MDRIIRASELAKLLGLSRTTIWRLESDESFPKKIQLTSHSVGWKLSEINAWLADR